MADKRNQIEITPGTPKFNKMVFRLIHGITPENVAELDYNHNRLQEIQKNVYVMPIYISSDFNLFMVVGKFVQNDWIVSFSKATIKHKNEVTDFSTPIPTGKGLNILGQRSPRTANRLLKYFNTLIQVKAGEWRLIK